MEYNNLRNKIGKFYNGGKIPKYQMGGSSYNYDEERAKDPHTQDYWMKKGMLPKQAQLKAEEIQRNGLTMPSDEEIYADIEQANQEQLEKLNANTEANLNNAIENANVSEAERQAAEKRASTPQEAQQPQPSKKGLNIGAIGMGIASAVLPGAVAAMDSLTSDKNFGAQSQAIDSAVHGVSGALMSSGNPFAMAAGASLEGVNFLTKAGGQTVQGYDVNIENSGYGNLGHQESSSSRSFLFGLGDITGKKMQAKLARRNEQARMALQAAEISEDVKFEQEARMNSVDNVLRNNQIALAGGIDTSLLGS